MKSKQQNIGEAIVQQEKNQTEKEMQSRNYFVNAPHSLAKVAQVNVELEFTWASLKRILDRNIAQNYTKIDQCKQNK